MRASFLSSNVLTAFIFLSMFLSLFNTFLFYHNFLLFVLFCFEYFRLCFVATCIYNFRSEPLLSPLTYIVPRFIFIFVAFLHSIFVPNLNLQMLFCFTHIFSFYSMYFKMFKFCSLLNWIKTSFSAPIPTVVTKQSFLQS